jgi:hypothetical protein
MQCSLHPHPTHTYLKSRWVNPNASEYKLSYRYHNIISLSTHVRSQPQDTNSCSENPIANPNPINTLSLQLPKNEPCHLYKSPQFPYARTSPPADLASGLFWAILSQSRNRFTTSRSPSSPMNVQLSSESSTVSSAVFPFLPLMSDLAYSRSR